jgi:hypothetical protein
MTDSERMPLPNDSDPLAAALAAANEALAEGAPLVAVPQPAAAEDETPDVLGALTAPTEQTSGVPTLNMEALTRLKELKASKERYERMAKALTPVIADLETAVIDNVMPHRAPDGRWSTTVGDKTGYLSTQLWPARRTNEETGEKFGTDDLANALRADGVDFLISESVHGQRLAGWMREQVEAWEARCGEDGVRNERGELVDHYGNALTAEEAADPTAPELALPPKVRAILAISTDMKISFRAR